MLFLTFKCCFLLSFGMTEDAVVVRIYTLYNTSICQNLIENSTYVGVNANWACSFGCPPNL